MLDLYKNIKRIREARGMTQAELAKESGFTSRSSINKIEKGLNDLSHTNILAIAKALRVTPMDLMGECATIPPPPPAPNDILDCLFADEPEFLDKIRSITIEGKLNEPGVIAKLTDRQKERIKDIIKLTYDEAVKNGGKARVKTKAKK